MNVAIYARVSTDMQAEQGYSLGAQITDCTAKAKELGGTIIKEYVDDGYSGAYLERPALQDMREAIRSKMFQVVVCYDVDRLSRNLSHQLLVTEEIEKSGASLVFVKSDYQSTPEGRMFYAIKGAFAGYEREKFRERSMRGRIAMLKQGKVIEDSHVYGYDYDKENHCYTINKVEAAIVREIFDLYLDGYGGIQSICGYLTAHYPPKSGKAWAKSLVSDILHREMYTGRFYSHRYYHFKTGLKSEKRVERPREEWIEMSCPAIITEEEHKEALKILERNSTVKERKGKIPALLQGLAYCGSCGHLLHTKTVSHKKRYVCWRDNNQGKSGPGCGARSMFCATVDEAFWEMLREICHSTASLKRYLQATSPAKIVKHEKKNPQEQLAKIKAERKSVMSWFSQQLLTHEEATERLEALKKAEEKLMQENVPAKPTTPQRSLQAIVEAVSTCEESSEVRREVVKRIIDRVILTRTDKRKGQSHYQLDIKIIFR
jgi:site-specific DNA recombinase